MDRALSDTEVRARIDAVPHWYHQIEIRPGIVTPGINKSAATLDLLELPVDCHDMRVLDIGVRDGFFSFELERRGAEVVAIDYMDPAETGFPVARELIGSKVEYLVDNVYNVTPERYGTFDLVLFLGVMYHLRDPLLVLDRLWNVCNEGAQLALETQLCDSALLLDDGSFTALQQIDPRLGELCLMQFHPGDSLHGDNTNYWSPNAACTRGLMAAAGFEVVRDAVLGRRGIFVGRRVFESTQVYYRRIEKATIAEGAGSHIVADPTAQSPPGGAAGSAELSSANSVARDPELATARRHQLALESELAQARLELSALRDGSGSPAGVGGARLRDGLQRGLSALRRRTR